jgi:hypothetical protein
MQPNEIRQALLAHKLANLMPLWDYEILKTYNIKWLKNAIKMVKRTLK